MVSYFCQTFQHCVCVQELQSWQSARISRHVEPAMKRKNDKLTSCSEHIQEIVNSLDLVSNQELLKESIAVEKENMELHANKCNDEIAHINLAIDLLALIREYILKNGCWGQ